jgi:hypothetical protein
VEFVIVANAKMNLEAKQAKNNELFLPPFQNL